MTAGSISVAAARSRRPYTFVALLAGATGVLTVAVALAKDLPLRDPDGIAGPAYIRLPLILTLLALLDVIPRAVRRRRGAGGIVPAVRGVVAERWSLRRAGIVLLGLFAFYITYVGYRNLKSFLPFVREDTADEALLELDRAMTFGTDPAVLLHDLLGTGLSAHVLSAVYVFFLIFVPLSLGAALVWSRDLRRGFWWVTALCVAWVLGAASYYLLPSLGPVYAEPGLFALLPQTGVSELQDTLWRHRGEVLAGPHATDEVHGIAGFASLHVAIVFAAAWFAHVAGLPGTVRRVLWAFFALTVLATVYFGWHYLVDDVAGVLIGWLAVRIGAWATGHHDALGGLRARRPAIAGSDAR